MNLPGGAVTAAATQEQDTSQERVDALASYYQAHHIQESLWCKAVNGWKNEFIPVAQVLDRLRFLLASPHRAWQEEALDFIKGAMGERDRR